MVREENYDVVIVGCGVGGLYTALNLPSEDRILMICKEDIESCDSMLAQGGICVLRDETDYDAYFEDTMRAGHYENRKESVDIMIRSSRDVINNLLKLGVGFDKNPDGSLKYTKEGAHSQPRICFHEDITGKEITTTLQTRVKELPNVEIREYTVMTDILVDKGVCTGILAKNADGDKALLALGLAMTSTVSDTGAKVNDDNNWSAASDAKIKLNGAEYTSSTNEFAVNGLSVTALAKTSGEISVTVATDSEGIYEQVKDLLSQYNSLINEMNKLYNADSAKGYEPLTDDEKDSMSDTEVEKWEAKVKDSLLRRDDSLESLISSMTTAMSKGYEVNGKTYYLTSFGISTLGYMNSAKNEQYAYHINGDEDDSATSGKEDKLLAAIKEDPDSVAGFMQQLATGLYDSIDKKMKTSTLSSIFKVYNDKEMASEYSDYTTTIKKWEDKLSEQEDYYYKKFSAMETALAKLNSQTSSLSGLFGS